MYSCPHCHEAGFSTFAKLFAVSFAPATCSHCGGQAYLHITHALMALIAWIILTWIFIGVAIWQGMSIYLIGTIPAFVLAVDKFMLKAPMRACH